MHFDTGDRDPPVESLTVHVNVHICPDISVRAVHFLNYFFYPCLFSTGARPYVRDNTLSNTPKPSLNIIHIHLNDSDVTSGSAM